MPPTFALPATDGSGSRSSVSSGMKHWSIQDRDCMNRSSMPFNSAIIRGNFSSDRPQSSSVTLCWRQREFCSRCVDRFIRFNRQVAILACDFSKRSTLVGRTPWSARVPLDPFFS